MDFRKVYGLAQKARLLGEEYEAFGADLGVDLSKRVFYDWVVVEYAAGADPRARGGVQRRRRQDVLPRSTTGSHLVRSERRPRPQRRGRTPSGQPRGEASELNEY